MFRLLVLMAVFCGSALHAQSAEEAQFVQALLRNMNAQSVTYDREVCAYVVRSPSGRLESSKVSWGGPASCGTTPVPPGYEILSSWHTHAAWAAGYDNEVPSSVDVEGDLAQGVNGWISTPGGRLWFIDGQTGDMYQYCEAGCLPSDPNAQMDARGPVSRHYTLQGLRARAAGR